MDPPKRRRRRRRLAALAGTSARGASQTEIMVAASTETYRRLAAELPLPDDAVLEIGCSSGATTQILARRSRRVLAVDVSAPFVERVRADLAHASGVTALQLDGRDVPDLAAHLPNPDLIFVDIGGNAQLDNVVLQVRQCLMTFSPRVLVVKSAELSALCSLVTWHEAPEHDPLRPRSTEGTGAVLANLLDLSRSSSSVNRVYAARRLGVLRSRHPSPEADRRLEELAEDPDERVSRMARLKLQGHPDTHYSHP